MADKSKIEWTDATWNPIRARNLKTGKIGWHCEHATTACEFCYAEGFNLRLGTGLPFKPGHRKDIEIFLDDKMLLAPLRWKKPRMIFVCSMTDAFADFVTDEVLDKMFAVMALCPQHTFQVLTKRAERMRFYLESIKPHDGRPWDRITDIAVDIGHQVRGYRGSGGVCARPLPNVHLGVSAERQQEADERIPLLLETPAAVRFLSAEPLLGAIDLTAIEAPDKVEGERWTFSALQTGDYYTQHDDLGRSASGDGPYREHALDWVIVGGESGKDARPMHPHWARSLRDQCAAADVPFFFKQWGEWLGGDANRGQFDARPMHSYRRADNHSYEWPPIRASHSFDHADPLSGNTTAKRVGKKAAGRLLDGVEHNGFPAIPRAAP